MSGLKMEFKDLKTGFLYSIEEIGNTKYFYCTKKTAQSVVMNKINFHPKYGNKLEFHAPEEIKKTKFNSQAWIYFQMAEDNAGKYEMIKFLFNRAGHYKIIRL